MVLANRLNCFLQLNLHLVLSLVNVIVTALPQLAETASQLSGFDEEIQIFRNGKAKQYKEAERTLRDIKEMTNEAAIEERIEYFKDNQFFRLTFGYLPT